VNAQEIEMKFLILLVAQDAIVELDLRGALAGDGRRILRTPRPKLAAHMVKKCPQIRAVVVDIDGETDHAVPLLVAAKERGVPCVVVTVEDEWPESSEFEDCIRVPKPFSSDRVAAVLNPLLEARVG